MVIEDYAAAYHALTKLDSVYTYVTQNRLVEYLASYFVRNEIMANLMYLNMLKMVKWMLYDFYKKLSDFTIGFLFDGCVLLVPCSMPTPKFRASCLKWWSRIFVFAMLLLLLSKTKPYLLHHHPIEPHINLGLETHRIWKTLAEHKRLWYRINQTQAHISRIDMRIQAEVRSLHERLNTVSTWDTISMVTQHLESLNASVEQRIQNAVRKSRNSVLVEFIHGKIILSPRLISLFQDKRATKEINRYLQKYADPQLAEALNHVIVLKTGEVQSMIDKEIARYHQDHLNRADFALLSRGGRIIHHSPSYRSPMMLRLFQKDQAQAAIQPSHCAGDCWSMKGNNGTITINLSENIQIDGISVEYPSPNIMLSMTNAPKDIFVYANLFTDHWRCIGQVQYSIRGPSIQTFHINNPNALSFRKVLVNITSNWGNEAQTDIYRIRIHGKPMSSLR